MDEQRKPQRPAIPAGRAAERQRQERLAAALRANLARRKAQTRQRAAAEMAVEPAKPRR